jgi:hypothetical protein
VAGCVIVGTGADFTLNILGVYANTSGFHKPLVHGGELYQQPFPAMSSAQTSRVS